MLHNAAGPWPSRLLTLLVWLAAGASAVAWGLKVSGPVGASNAAAVAGGPAAQADATAVARLLGARREAPVQQAAAPAPSRFQLAGVVAGRGTGGAALISVDGKPAKPFRVGTAIEPGLVLQSVAARRAVLADSLDAPPSFTLELPGTRK